jgi:hypothetical protein
MILIRGLNIKRTTIRILRKLWTNLSLEGRGMSKYESICNFKQKQRLAVYGSYHRDAEDKFQDGYMQALQDVRVILGGNSPVSPEKHKERAEIIDKIDLDIMQNLYCQVADIGWYMKQREVRKKIEIEEEGIIESEQEQ